VQKVEPALHEAWLAREQTYVDLQRALRNVGGNVGTGGLAVAEGSNVWNRLKALPPSTHLDPRVLHAFTTLFTRLDARVADVVEEGIARQVYFLRVKVPLMATDSGQTVAPAQERFIPLAEADRAAIVELVRDRLRPAPELPTAPPAAARSRAELHTAIVHQPERRAGKDGVGI
jgi:AcrR family transcriptional regulator